MKAFPYCPAFDHTNRAGAYAIINRYLCVWSAIISNCKNLQGLQFVHTVSFTNGVFTKSVPVSHVVSATTPRKIYGAIVCFIAVAVTNLVTLTAYKSSSDKAMNVVISFFVIFCQLYTKVTISVWEWAHGLRFHQPSRRSGIWNHPFNRADITKVANLVFGFIPKNGKPVFNHIIELTYGGHRVNIPWKDYP